MNEFEKKLQEQNFRSIPSNWRTNILQSAKSQAESKETFLSRLNTQITALLWPHPKAWAGVAAAWVLILGANITMNGDTNRSGFKSGQAPLAYSERLREQQQLLVQLTQTPAPVAEPPKVFKPRPHSERRRSVASA